jgi:hypothetical protein
LRGLGQHLGQRAVEGSGHPIAALPQPVAVAIVSETGPTCSGVTTVWENLSRL